jgi:hypothetical protein
MAAGEKRPFFPLFPLCLVRRGEAYPSPCQGAERDASSNLAPSSELSTCLQFTHLLFLSVFSGVPLKCLALRPTESPHTGQAAAQLGAGPGAGLPAGRSFSALPELRHIYAIHKPDAVVSKAKRLTSAAGPAANVRPQPQRRSSGFATRRTQLPRRTARRGAWDVRSLQCRPKKRRHRTTQRQTSRR